MFGKVSNLNLIKTSQFALKRQLYKFGTSKRKSSNGKPRICQMTSLTCKFLFSILELNSWQKECLLSATGMGSWDNTIQELQLKLHLTRSLLKRIWCWPTWRTAKSTSTICMWSHRKVILCCLTEDKTAKLSERCPGQRGQFAIAKC